MRVAAFIERDGLLNRAKVQHGQPVTPIRLDEFQILTEAAPLVRSLQSAGFLVIATTNQPGLSNGEASRREIDIMHEMLFKKLNLNDIMMCPHDEADDCPCRKPKPGLMIEAGFKWHVDLDRSVVISDKWHDAEAARIAGCTSILINSPWNGPGHYDFKVPSFEMAVEKALSISNPTGVLTR